MVVELFEYAKKGEINKAKEIYFKLLPIARAIGSEYNFPAPVKEAVNLLGRKAGPPRSPITQLSTKEKEEIKKALKHAGLIQ